jgi:hypothetical protein
MLRTSVEHVAVEHMTDGLDVMDVMTVADVIRAGVMGQRDGSGHGPVPRIASR